MEGGTHRGSYLRAVHISFHTPFHLREFTIDTTNDGRTSVVRHDLLRPLM